MQLLVSCPRQLLWLDTVRGEIRTVEADRPEYYGISWPEHGRHLCLGHSGVENASLQSLESYMDSERGWLSYGQHQGPRSLSAVHQILCAGDRVIATNTGRNCITVFRTDDWYYRHYWIDQIRWDRMGRENPCGRHLNSVFLQDGLLYVIAHNHDRGSEVVRLAWPELDVVGIDRTSTLMAHNLWLTDEGQMIVCDSMRGTLVDVLQDEVVWRCDVPKAVTRGLAACDGYVFVGHSAVGTREARVHRDSHIWVVDRRTWKTLDVLNLPRSGNIHELRLLDQPDLCHHGHIFRGELAMCEAEPWQARRVVAWSGDDTEVSVQAAQAAARVDAWDQREPFAEFDGRRARAADFSLATLKQFHARDVVVRARVDLRQADARHAGVVARYQGPADRNMLVALIAKTDGGYRVQLWRQAAGKWSCLSSAAVRQGHGTLELRAVGRDIQVAFEGRTAIRAKVSGPLSAGSIGLRAARGSIDAFQFSTTDVQASRRAA
jgi:hypothetical protein